MARKKKLVALEEQIQALNTEIEDLTKTLADKKSQLKTLNATLEAENNKKILAAIKNSGKNISEIINFLESDKKET